MNNNEIKEQILKKQDRLDETIVRAARFRHQPIKASWFYLLVSLNRYLSLNIPIKATTVWGDEMTATETSAVGSIYFLGFYDIDTSLFLLKHFDEKGDFLDVGSNIGYYSLLANQILGPEAKIVAFEPTPTTFRLLEQNTKPHSRIILEKIALADQEGVTTFIDYGPRNAVFNSTKAQTLDFLKGQGSEIEVATTTLDKYCSGHSISPSLIKLDTEGTEAGILRNGTETLRLHTPVILIEVGGGTESKENTLESLDILRDLGYEFFNLSTVGDLLPHTRQDSYTYANLVCIHRDKIPKYDNH